MPDLGGRVAIVTGANHGIGAAVGEALAAEGASVILTYLSLPVDSNQPEAYSEVRSQDASAVLSRIESRGGRARAVEADLRDDDGPSRVFDFAESTFGPAEILINNASGWLADTFVDSDVDELGRPLAGVSAESIDTALSVDARGSALMIAEYSRRHRESGLEWGRIVGITSGGWDGFPGEVSYGAAKAALESYTMSAALELGDRGVTANIVHPPITDTGWITDEVKAFVDSDRNLRIAQPDEVAEIIVFLCSEQAGLITANRIELH